jgi:Phosphoenolpyruvate hydrolase-like
MSELTNSGVASEVVNAGHRDEYPIVPVLTKLPPLFTSAAALLSPAMHGLPAGRASALALLPIHDVNGRLFQVLEGRSALPQSICAGVFAVDPFQSLADVWRRLRSAGIAQLANWPSVGLYGVPLTEELTSKGLGYEREVRFVAQAALEGFRVTATVFDRLQAESMVAAGATRLLYHPPLVDGRVMDIDDAIQFCRAEYGGLVTSAPAWLYCEGAPTRTTELDRAIEKVVLYRG